MTDRPAFDLGRVTGVTDNVFVVAMTLLVLELVVPPLVAPAPLGSTLLGLLPKFIVFAVGFLLLSIYWKSALIQARWIARYDQTLLAILVILLLAVAALPFGVALAGSYWRDPLAIQVFAAMNTMCTILLAWHWWHLTGKPQLLSQPVAPRFRVVVALRFLAPATANIVCAVVAAFSTGLAAAIGVVVVLAWSMPGISKLVWYRGPRAT